MNIHILKCTRSGSVEGAKAVHVSQGRGRDGFLFQMVIRVDVDRRRDQVLPAGYGRHHYQRIPGFEAGVSI